MRFLGCCSNTAAVVPHQKYQVRTRLSVKSSVKVSIDSQITTLNDRYRGIIDKTALILSHRGETKIAKAFKNFKAAFPDTSDAIKRATPAWVSNSEEAIKNYKIHIGGILLLSVKDVDSFMGKTEEVLKGIEDLGSFNARKPELDSLRSFLLECQTARARGFLNA